MLWLTNSLTSGSINYKLWMWEETTMFGGVDTSAPDSDRVSAMRAIISDVVDDIDDSGDLNNKKKFMLHVAWHEGAQLRQRVQQPPGPTRPGRSFFQMEKLRPIEAYEWAETNGWIPRLLQFSGLSAAELQTAIDHLRNHPGSTWPMNSIIEDRLISDQYDVFSTYLSRIALKRINDEIGPSNQDHAEYWAKWWKRVFNSEQERVEKIATFKAEADAVDLI